VVLVVSGKYSVPVLWDKSNKVIVNNESSEIIRMFNSAFNKHAKVRNPPLAWFAHGLVYASFNHAMHEAFV
jgi:glutathionyl-hydroquinone reductase